MELYHLILFFLLMKSGPCDTGNLRRDGGEELPQKVNEYLAERETKNQPELNIPQFSSDPVMEMISELQKTVQELQKRLGKKEGESRHRREADQGIPQDDCPPQGYTLPLYTGQCLQCPPGPPGPQGPPGSQGERGRDGRDGRDVSYRPEGFRSHPANQSGPIYVRWGRNDCPSSSTLVYNGVTGGEAHSNNGGGVNFLCMPHEPVYDEPVAGVNTWRGYVFGTEYQTGTFPPFGHLRNTEVPCSVCRAVGRHGLLMIPATNVCPGSEWTEEYHGYLMTEYHDRHSRKEFVCVDRNAVSVPNSSTRVTESLLYPVESHCESNGGLPCGPYVHGYELTCVVCTI